MTEKSYKENRLKTLLLIAIIVFIAFLFIPYSPFFITYLVENTEGNNNYIIKISGLEGLVASGETTIMIPIPTYIDGEPVFSEDCIKRINNNPDVYRMNSNWNLSVEDTPYGKMLAFKSSKKELSDLDMIFAEFDRKSEPRLLMPAFIVPEDINFNEFSAKEHIEYKSCIYINGTLDPDDKSIQFDLRYRGGGEKKFMFKTDIWKSSLSASILTENTGYSNVSVNYIVTENWN